MTRAAFVCWLRRSHVMKERTKYTRWDGEYRLIVCERCGHERTFRVKQQKEET